MINQCGLIDLGFDGPAYTWSNGRSPQFLIQERLDRVLANPDWSHLHPLASVSVLPRINSDHAPILLNTHKRSPYRRRSLKFEEFWTSHVEYSSIIKKLWRNFDLEYPSNIPMKLNHTLQHLNKWGKSNFGNIKLRIPILKSKLLDIRSMNPNPSNVLEERSLAQELNDLLHLEDTYWKQRAKRNWIRDGNRNTKYFHLCATARKRKNAIQNLQLEDGSWTNDHEAISNRLVDHFRKLFQ
ncbi:uncharacterized protein M6B38_206310 [Iris pallida]|uniref:Endonuclease/exonuclease/phosphatase domain-containing protein n=1 Tax=Iris pallida TaxID=29817 RepID=A0AAX6E6H5_IRIPA|nr:uncharacterized protein M6B38_206310 [Iris pallida]